MSVRIYIHEIQDKLHYKDRRSAIRWCENNSVELFSDTGSKRLFALNSSFENAYTPPKTTSKVLHSAMSFFSRQEYLKVEKTHSYISQGEHEASFLSILQSLKSAL